MEDKANISEPGVVAEVTVELCLIVDGGGHLLGHAAPWLLVPVQQLCHFVPGAAQCDAVTQPHPSGRDPLGGAAVSHTLGRRRKHG